MFVKTGSKKVATARFILASMLLVALSACSARVPLEPLVQVGAERFGSGGEFITFEVPPEEEAPFRLTRTSPAGRRLAQLFAPAQRSVVRIIVGGPSSTSTKEVILEALTLNKGRTLGGLELVFVGDAVDARELAQASKAYLLTLHFTDIQSLSDPGKTQ